MYRIVLLASFFCEAYAHGWIHTPISKNEMANHHYVDGMPDTFRYEPQTSYWGNNAGKMMQGAGYSCGAKEADSSQGLGTWQKWYDAAKVPVPTITPGEELELKITITADHGGQSWLTIACADHIGEDTAWTYLERAEGDRGHHFMPSNPGIYAWATSEAASKTGGQITASWLVPKDFACPSGKVVGRWLWKTGSSCNDVNNIGRKTQTFKAAEYGAVLNQFHSGSWVKADCTEPAETFITCLDFVMSGSPPGPPSPPTPPTPPAPPAPTPPPAPAPHKTPTCCFSNWGDDTTCGEYTGPGSKCNTDPTKKCYSSTDCPKDEVLFVPPPCPFQVVAPKCCWSKWGDASSCGNYTGPGAQCNTDHTKSCASDSDCPSTPGPSPAPPSPPAPPAPTPPSPPSPPSPVPPAPAGAVSACHDAAKAYCSTKGGYCMACQAWGNWGDMFFVTICNDDPTVCHSPLQAAGNVTCSCQRAGGCTSHGATCPGPSLLV